MTIKNIHEIQADKRSKPYPIVAIGASAGGLEAITDLLKHLPPDTGMAFIYIQHLDPNHKSMLSQILGKATKMTVVEAAHLARIQPNHVFIIPPDKNMSVIDGVITLNERKPKPLINMPVDQFFLSLAEKQKEGSIGVILSGTASDGTLGLKAIKAAGGFTFAQDDSARFQSMPKSAIAQGVVDKVLSAQGIAMELAKLSKQTELIAKITTLENETEEDVTESDSEIITDNDEDLLTIIKLLKKSAGVDFIHYKRTTIKRRILRRMVLHRQGALDEYLEFLKQNPDEIHVLYKDLLIHITAFFREPKNTEYLKHQLLPGILKSKLQGDPFRIWVPACSTGEEAYSLAMTILEVLEEQGLTIPVQIFATDISEQAIAKARMGLYNKNELQNISSRQLQLFFVKTDGSFRITKSVRDLCVFAPHNVFRDPPFSRLDLISCCNLLIYLDHVLQKKVLGTFYYSLNQIGYLVLGKSESISSHNQLFGQLEKNTKIFQKKLDTDGKSILDESFRNYEKTGMDRASLRSIQKDETAQPGIDRVVEEILLTKFVPPSVLINEDLEILQFRGSTGLFLEPSPGKASLNLIKMARPGIAYELRRAFQKANKQGKAVRKTGLQIMVKEKIHHVNIEVLPLPKDGDEKLFLVIFVEQELSGNTLPQSSDLKDDLVKKLQDDLNVTKEDMRSILEDNEAATEELQSANEEITSSNEELQSINEELETSKEELESTNEELITINTELQIRNEQLQEAYDYSSSIAGTVREAIIVLDEHLHVQWANNPFYSIFQVTESETEGMLIYELGNKQWDIPQLRHLLEDILKYNTEFSGLEVKHNFLAIGKKLMLLNARKVVQRIQGHTLIFLAIEDITEQREAERIINERELLFRNMADNAPVMIWVTGTDHRRSFFNQTWLAFTGRHVNQEKELGWIEGIHPDDKEIVTTEMKRSMDMKSIFKLEYRLRRYDGEFRYILDFGKPTFIEDGVFTGYIGSSTDIHDKKVYHEELSNRVEERTQELQDTNKELSRSNSELQQFAYVASHDLQEPLRKIITFSDKLQAYKESLPPGAHGFIEKIITSSQRMTRLIDDLLNFSGIARTNQKFSWINVTDVIKDVIVNFELIIIQKKARILFEKLPVLQAIPLQMDQLFHNLLSNAMKFSRDGVPPVITVSSRMLSETEVAWRNLKSTISYTEIVVADNGIGFKPEFAEQIFTIFQRLNSRYEYPGTGIGLALCRKIALNHGGEMYAQSEPGQGARFYLILPLKQDSNIER